MATLHIQHPITDFDSAAEAQSFRGFLTAQVWSNPENSPGLAGTPETMVLESVSL